jgi:hypothetical protein
MYSKPVKMSLNKFTNTDIGKKIELKIGCKELNAESVIANHILIPDLGDFEAYDILATHSLRTKTPSNGVINYTTPTMGFNNFSLHTDGNGSCFWSPDNTTSTGITYDGSIPTVVGTHLLFNSLDAERVNESKLIESVDELNFNSLNLKSVGTVNNIDLSDISTNSNFIVSLNQNKLNVSGSNPMTGALNLANQDINNTKIQIFNNQSTTPSTPAVDKTKLYVKSDGKVYLLNSDGLEVSLSSNAIYAAWKFDTLNTPSNLGNGYFSFNNLTPSNTTQINLSKFDSDGRDLSPILQIVESGDVLTFISEDSNNIKLFAATGSVLINANVYTVPCVLLSQSLFNAFSQNALVSVETEKNANPFNQQLNTFDEVNFTGLNSDGPITAMDQSIIATKNGKLLLQRDAFNGSVFTQSNLLSFEDFDSGTSTYYDKWDLGVKNNSYDLTITNKLDNQDFEALRIDHQTNITYLYQASLLNLSVDNSITFGGLNNPQTLDIDNSGALLINGVAKLNTIDQSITDLQAELQIHQDRIDRLEESNFTYSQIISNKTLPYNKTLLVQNQFYGFDDMKVQLESNFTHQTGVNVPNTQDTVLGGIYNIQSDITYEQNILGFQHYEIGLFINNSLHSSEVLGLVSGLTSVSFTITRLILLNPLDKIDMRIRCITQSNKVIAIGRISTTMILRESIIIPSFSYPHPQSNKTRISVLENTVSNLQSMITSLTSS